MYPVRDSDKITVTETGNIIKAVKTEYCNSECHIQKLSQDTYLLKKTGEVMNVKHSDNRKDNLDSLRKSFAKLKDIINTNCTVAENIRWCTLTYAENMTDHNRLYEDYRKFWQRFKRYCKKNNLSIPEYICIAEPQRRNAWHAHVLLIWQSKAPYIDNRIFQNLWSHGYTDIQAVKDADNFGSYLSAYVSDVALEDISDSGLSLTDLKDVKNVNGKMYAKGSRLHLYPTGMKLFRCSKGIKRPVVYSTTNSEFMKTITSEKIPMTYEKSLTLIGHKNFYVLNAQNGFSKSGEHPYECKVNIRYFNRSEIAKEKYYLVEIHRKSKLWRDMWDEFCEPYTLENPPQIDDSHKLIYELTEKFELINESITEQYYSELDLAEKYRKRGI